MKFLPILSIAFSFIVTTPAFVQEPMVLAKAASVSIRNTPTKSPTTFVFQAFTSDYRLAEITEEMAGEHFLGSVVAKKLYLLDEVYTSEVAVVPGNPQSKMVVKKPAIYNSVRRIEKYLTKSVKRGQIQAESATADLNKVLDIALSIISADTGSFEAAIDAANDDPQRIFLFTKCVTLTY